MEAEKPVRLLTNLQSLPVDIPSHVRFHGNTLTAFVVRCQACVATILQIRMNRRFAFRFRRKSTENETKRCVHPVKPGPLPFLSNLGHPEFHFLLPSFYGGSVFWAPTAIISEALAVQPQSSNGKAHVPTVRNFMILRRGSSSPSKTETVPFAIDQYNTLAFSHRTVDLSIYSGRFFSDHFESP